MGTVQLHSEGECPIQIGAHDVGPGAEVQLQSFPGRMTVAVRANTDDHVLRAYRFPFSQLTLSPLLEAAKNTFEV